MPKTVKISDELATSAAVFARVENRSLAGQVEYWAKLGRIAEENPDLPISFIKDILIGRAQVQSEQKTLTWSDVGIPALGQSSCIS